MFLIKCLILAKNPRKIVKFIRLKLGIKKTTTDNING